MPWIMILRNNLEPEVVPSEDLRCNPAETAIGPSINGAQDAPGQSQPRSLLSERHALAWISKFLRTFELLKLKCLARYCRKPMLVLQQRPFISPPPARIYEPK